DDRSLRAWLRDRVRTDLLGDPAGFAGGDGCRTDPVEERGLAVVDVAEDGNDRRPRLQHLRLVLFLLGNDFLAGFLDDRIEAELTRDGDRLIRRDVLIDRRH